MQKLKEFLAFMENPIRENAVDEDKAKEYIILYWDKPLDKPGNNE